MLDTLLGKIAGLFEKDFLFASFLPALIFITALVVTVAGVVSIEAIWAWVDAWTATQKASAAVASTLFTVVVAYILQALRTSFTRGWTGNSHSMWLWGFNNLGVLFQKWRYRRRRKASWKLSPWQKVLDAFDEDLRPFWSNALNPAANGREPLPASNKPALEQRVDLLRVGMTEAAVKEQLKEIINAYKIYSGDDLADIYNAIKDKLREWHDNEIVRIQTDTYYLDRWFGRLQTIKATTLGNVIEAYNLYAFKRYKIEPDIFWPRLRKVVTPEYLAVVQESRILLDFLLTMATLAALYALLALSVGPWLWFSLWLWLPLALLALAISYFFYRLSIGAAYELGEMVRSCFDLFRLDLMVALQRPRPATLSAEQAQWEELSNLAVYGFTSSFALRAEKDTGSPPAAAPHAAVGSPTPPP
jgi:hypothetical protein